MPNGQMPALEIDGELVGESNSLLRYLGAKYGYYPDDASQAF